MNPLIANRLSAGVRQAEKSAELRKKYGECKACDGRSYVGTYENGYDCPTCKGTGANLPKDEK